jgi:hypothetical protein
MCRRYCYDDVCLEPRFKADDIFYIRECRKSFCDVSKFESHLRFCFFIFCFDKKKKKKKMLLLLFVDEIMSIIIFLILKKCSC